MWFALHAALPVAELLGAGAALGGGSVFAEGLGDHRVDDGVQEFGAVVVAKPDAFVDLGLVEGAGAAAVVAGACGGRGVGAFEGEGGCHGRPFTVGCS